VKRKKIKNDVGVILSPARKYKVILKKIEIRSLMGISSMMPESASMPGW
jgi:hypothetical protein